jgi:molybdate transport system regulatory protein
MSTDEGREGDAGSGGSVRVRTKVWVERGGEVVMSEYRALLLETIARTGSVARAANEMHLPYRTAWKKLREMEAAAGVPLLNSDSGGAGGGQSSLTPDAVEMLAAFRRLSDPIGEQTAERFEDEAEHFDL